MSRGSKEKYTEAQKRKARHIEESYEEKGVPEEKAEAIAWATVNKQSGGGERSGGSGHEKPTTEKEKARKMSARRAAASRKGISRADSLELETKDSLLKQARARNISGRSSMNKSELIAALKKSQIDL